MPIAQPDTSSAPISAVVGPHSLVLVHQRWIDFVFVPLDRKYLKFNGRSGVMVHEWIEEA